MPADPGQPGRHPISPARARISHQPRRPRERNRTCGPDQRGEAGRASARTKPVGAPADHATAVLAFEQANRAYFAAFVSDRGDEFFDQFTDRHSALLAEQVGRLALGGGDHGQYISGIRQPSKLIEVLSATFR
jgi:hypothetical protein